jgi:biotin carboxyl carrier protein
MARVNVNGMAYDVRIDSCPDAGMSIKKTPRPALPKKSMTEAPEPPRTSLVPSPSTVTASPHSDGNVIKAPMPGLILDVKVKPGDAVTAGMAVIIMEVMKMENSITARISGIVQEVYVQKGAQVMTGAPLLAIR